MEAGRQADTVKRLIALLAAGLALPAVALAQDWHSLPTPKATDAVIESNPMQGFYSWLGPDMVPVKPLSPDHYTRVSWADLEPREGVYDFSKLDNALKNLPAGNRIAFGVMAADTCCSGDRSGLYVPAYLKDGMAKGFWVKANPGSWHLDQAYIPDWNDPLFLTRWHALWAAIGKRYDGDPRIAWVDMRGYGNWGEGHLNGDSAYHWGQLPYDDPKVNLHGAEAGTLDSRIAIVDAIIDAMPHTQLIAMSDDKPVMLHAFHAKTAIPIGLRRDSWGAKWFEKGLAEGDLTDAERAEISDRWKVAPFIVESFGWTLAFEVGFDGLTRQVVDYHISDIGNGNFGTDDWKALSADQQQALIRAGNHAGYRYVPVAAKYRHEADCPLRLAVSWRNDGSAPAYEPWAVRLWLKRDGGSPVELKAVGDANLPKILPGETADSQGCYALPDGASGELSLQMMLAAGPMWLALEGGDAKGRYDLGPIAP